MNKYKYTLNVIRFALPVGVIVFLATAAQAAAIGGLYNTGVNNSGVVLPLGSAELHYSLTSSVSSAIVAEPNSAWVAPPAGSAWIGPSAGTADDPSGDYTYALTFDLTGLNPSTVVISGLLIDR